VVVSELNARLRCLASLLQQLNAKEACVAVNEAIAALTRSEVPAGMVLVPVEPVAAMVDAGVKHEPWSDYSRVRMIYRSMLAAAPNATGGASHDD